MSVSYAAEIIVRELVCENARCRSAQILQPVQRDYAAQILTVPTGTRMMYEQPQSTPVAVVGQANRPAFGQLSVFLRVSRHFSIL